MKQHIIANLDSVFLFYGAAFFFLGAVCLILAIKEKGSFALWLSLAFFGFLRGVGVWLEMISVSLVQPRFFDLWRGVAAAFSFLFLLEFFRRGLVERLWKKAEGRLFKITVFILFVYMLSAFFDDEAFLAVVGFPVQLLRGFLAAGAALVLLYAATSSAHFERRRRRQAVFSARIILGAFLAFCAISLFAGFVLVGAVGDHERAYLDRMIRSDARLLRSAIGAVDFEVFEGSRDGSLYPRYRAMHERMAELSDMATFIKSLYLVTVKDGYPSFLVGSQTQIFPRDLPLSFGASVPEKILMDAIHSKNPTFWRREGHGVSAKSHFCVFIPLLNSKGEARLLLGMDLDSAKIHRQVSKARMFALFVVGAFLILLVGGYASLTIFALKNAELESQKAELKKTLHSLKEAEAELSKSEETFRGILNNSPNAIFGFDRDLRLIFWNTGAEKIYGYRRAELIDDKNPILSKKATDILGAEAAARLEEVFAGITRQEEGAQKTKNGMMDAAMTLFPVKDRQGRILFGMGLVQNVFGRGKR